MTGERSGWTWGAAGEEEEEGETGPASDKGRYNQVITSDKTEEEKESRGGALERDRGRGGMKAVRGLPGPIRERQRRRDSQAGIRCTRGGGKHGRKITDIRKYFGK